jgi:AMP nucleosidase
MKTKQSSQFIYDNYMADHIEKGSKILKVACDMQAHHVKGAYHRNIEPVAPAFPSQL